MPGEASLIRPMFEGPVDLIGDVHGELDALQILLQRLGYDAEGRHEEDRKLVFIGDLVDRGPDSPAVVALVKRLIDVGRAQCVLGNHELNLLRGKKKYKSYNYWFHREGDPAAPAHADQKPLPEHERGQLLNWIRTLPVALERDDLRAVHACWDDSAAAPLRQATDALALMAANAERITAQLEREGITDEVEHRLTQQNSCAIKLFTSGPEERADELFEAGERLRYEARVPWWNDYASDVFCVFGHYSRTKFEAVNGSGMPLFPANPFTAVGRTMCIDLGVGARAAQRRDGGLNGSVHLAALRWPERIICTDNGQYANIEVVAPAEIAN